MSMIKCLPIFASIAIVSFLSIPIAAEDTSRIQFESHQRTWTDATGDHEIRAALVAYQDRQLTLQKTDGSELTVSVDKISKQDRDFLASLLRAERRNRHRATLDPNLDENESKPAKTDHAAALADEDVNEGIEKVDAQRLYEIDWYDSDTATQVADQTDKPVLWFRVLGDLEGFM